MTAVLHHRPMTKRMRTIVWLCGGALAAVQLTYSEAGLAQAQTAAPVARAVTTVKAARSCFDETIQVTGAVSPRNEVLVRSDREGWQISQVLVEAGDSVTSGQVLARLRPPDGQRATGDNAVQAASAGVIFASAAMVGGVVSQSGEPLFRIARDGEMEIVGELTSDSMARLKSDLASTVEIVGVGQLSGKVRLISTSVNPTTQLGQVHISVGADPRIRVGVFGKATIQISRRCGPALPLSAVLYGAGGQFVQVVRNDRVETRRVEVGIVRPGEAELRSGVLEGEIVIARAGAFVRDGDLVRSVAGPQPAARQ
jgi:multidrug efflux pump subunit AcrA (membrane-fusion protein)